MNHANAIAFLREVHALLACENDLSPENPRVNETLGRLVATVKSWQRHGFGSDLPDSAEAGIFAESLPPICARAECEMEKWWARQILASDCPGAQALTAFWYLDEYKALCGSELTLIGSRTPDRAIFLGSGALPVTAILMARSRPDLSVVCVDCDGDACELAERLIAALGLSGRIAVENCMAEDFTACSSDTIICASLLQAPSLFDRLWRRRVQRLIVRDAEGPYRFCYRPARLPRHGYAESARSGMATDRINISRYLEWRPENPASLDQDHFFRKRS